MFNPRLMVHTSNFAIAYSTHYLVDADHANLQSKVFFVWGSFW